MAGQDTTNAEVMDLVNVIDLDGNGKIDFPDFLTMMLVFEFSFGLEADDDDMFKEFEYAFNTFDGDGSGNISIRDLRVICEGMSGSIQVGLSAPSSTARCEERCLSRAERSQLDPEEVEELIMEADIDGDGMVSAFGVSACIIMPHLRHYSHYCESPPSALWSCR